MNNKIDLHIHTNYSDGEWWPNQVIERAKENGLSTISITDHNTVYGYKDIHESFSNGIEIIPGIEFTANTTKGEMHILGYGIDVNNKELNESIAKMNDNARKYVWDIICGLEAKFNIKLCSDELHSLFSQKEKRIGRMDIAQILLRRGCGRNLNDIYQKFLNPVKKELIIKEKGLSAEECINSIISAGGVAVLAHPITLQTVYLSELENILVYLKSLGLEGIEVYNSRHSHKNVVTYSSIAQKHDLLISGGSDFHGPNVTSHYKIGKINNIDLYNTNINILQRIRKQK